MTAADRDQVPSADITIKKLRENTGWRAVAGAAKSAGVPHGHHAPHVRVSGAGLSEMCSAQTNIPLSAL